MWSFFFFACVWVCRRHRYSHDDNWEMIKFADVHKSEIRNQKKNDNNNAHDDDNNNNDNNNKRPSPLTIN